MSAGQVKLSEAEDAPLRQVEQPPGLHEKVRLRAKVLRSSHQGMSAKEIAAYLGWPLSSVRRDDNRWEQRVLLAVDESRAVRLHPAPTGQSPTPQQR